MRPTSKKKNNKNKKIKEEHHLTADYFSQQNIEICGVGSMLQETACRGEGNVGGKGRAETKAVLKMNTS